MGYTEKQTPPPETMTGPNQATSGNGGGSECQSLVDTEEFSSRACILNPSSSPEPNDRQSSCVSQMWPKSLALAWRTLLITATALFLVGPSKNLRFKKANVELVLAEKRRKPSYSILPKKIYSVVGLESSGTRVSPPLLRKF